MDKRVVEGVVGVVALDGRLLAIRRAQGIRAGGAWCLPGGAIEAGESQEQAIVREMQEELGLTVRPIRKVWEWLRPDGALLLHWWLVEPIGTLEGMVPCPAEVAEVRLVSAGELRGLEPVLESNLLFVEHYERTCEQS
jgi:8-oxo-dGTP diphosphatase